MRNTVFITAFAAALCFTGAAAAQDERERARAFVDEVSYSSGSGESQIARWRDDICVGAVGLDAAQAQALVDRISARAGQVGLNPGAPGCRANVMVIYAPDADALTRQIVDQRRDLLGYYANGTAVTAGRQALDEFANTPRPIRWWHVSDAGAGSLNTRPGIELDRQASGRTTAQSAGAAEGSASGTESGGDMQGMDAVRVSGSRARTTPRNNMSYALVVVDARRVADVSPNAWMDYVAFVSLAQIDPNAQANGYETILNLFDTGASAQTGLSDWDEAYLRALYRARRDAAGSRQAADIARRMVE
jgi:hypothetical protein